MKNDADQQILDELELFPSSSVAGKLVLELDLGTRREFEIMHFAEEISEFDNENLREEWARKLDAAIAVIRKGSGCR